MSNLSGGNAHTRNEAVDEVVEIARIGSRHAVLKWICIQVIMDADNQSAAREELAAPRKRFAFVRHRKRAFCSRFGSGRVIIGGQEGGNSFAVEEQSEPAEDQAEDDDGEGRSLPPALVPASAPPGPGSRFSFVCTKIAEWLIVICG